MPAYETSVSSRLPTRSTRYRPAAQVRMVGTRHTRGHAASPMNEAKKLIALTPQEIHRMVDTLLLMPDICRILTRGSSRVTCHVSRVTWRSSR